MAVVIDSRAWEDHFAKEYNHITTQLLAGTTSRYPHLHPHLVTAEHHIRHLLRHYFTWHSRIMREERYRITVGSGESTSMMDILEWGGKKELYLQPSMHSSIIVTERTPNCGYRISYCC